MRDVGRELVELGGGDPYDAVLQDSQAHQLEHGCGLHPAGPAVMQLAATLVRAAAAHRIVDLGCGAGYSTFWLAGAAGSHSRVVGIDGDADHIQLARSASRRLGLADRTEFIVGQVADVLPDVQGPVDAIHDDAWFARAPVHLGTMLGILRPGGLLTMPNWFLLVDALTGRPRNDWQRFAGPMWADDSIAYARLLAARRDVAVTWVESPPLGIVVKGERS